MPRRTSRWHLCAFAALLALLMWGALLQAKWGLVDDHEIVAMVGQADRLAWSDIPQTLQKTELASDATISRFRPGYYVLRVAEAAAWGKNATWWYLFRIGIATFFAVAFATFLASLVPLRVAFIALPFVLGGGYWADIFARAGPAETYAVLGLGLLLWGLKRQVSCPENCAITLADACLLALGLSLMIGSKENFLVLAAIPVWLILSRSGRIELGGRIVLLVPIGLAVWVGITLIDRLSGMDVYANSTSFSSRAMLLAGFLSLPIVWLWGLCCLGAAFPLYVKQGGLSESHRRRLKWALYINAALLGLFLFQYVFYAGKWPGGGPGRYLFPGIFAAQMGMLLIYSALHAIGDLSGSNVRWAKAMRLACVFTFLSVSSYALKVPVISNLKASLNTVKKTNQFERQFDEVAAGLRADPQRALLISSHAVPDYEITHSLLRFVRAKGLRNPVGVELVGYASADFKPGSLERKLSASMEELQSVGKRGFLPVADIPKQNCFSIGLSGPPAAECTQGITLNQY